MENILTQFLQEVATQSSQMIISASKTSSVSASVSDIGKSLINISTSFSTIGNTITNVLNSIFK